jgi:hypothetical protein
MSALHRRLTALEEIAEQVRRREIRRQILSLPESHDLTPAETEAAIDEYIRVLEQIRAWRREGVAERDILQHFADEAGMPVEELEAQCQALLETA